MDEFEHMKMALGEETAHKPKPKKKAKKSAAKPKAKKTTKRKPAKKTARKAKPTVVRFERLDMRLSKAEKAKVNAKAKKTGRTITAVVLAAIAKL